MSTPIHDLAKKYVLPDLLIGCLLVLLSTALPGRAQEPVEVVATEGGGRIEHHQVGGQELSIYVPKGYDTAALRYPVVYLIHGYKGTSRTFLGEGYPGSDAPLCPCGPWPAGNAVPKVEKLVASGQIDPLILAFPSLGGIAQGHSRRADAYIVEEVVPFVDAHYRTLPVRERRAVSGHSAGGTVAKFVTMIHPEVFGMAGSLSGEMLVGGLEEMKHLLLAHKQYRLPLQFWLYQGSRDRSRLEAQFINFLVGMGFPHFSFEDDGSHGGDSGPHDRVGQWLEANLLFFAQQFGQPMDAFSPLLSATEYFTTVVGSRPWRLDIEVVLDESLVEPGTRLSVDLSALGAVDPIPLINAGQGRYTAQPQITPSQNDVYWLPMLITKPAQTPEFFASIRLDIFPAADVVVFEETLDTAWNLEDNSRVTPTLAAFDGQDGLVLESTGSWRFTLAPEMPVELFGFAGLNFAFHPGTHTLPEGRDPRLQVGRVNLLEQVDLNLRQWQAVNLGIEGIGLSNGLLHQLMFSGNLEGTFYLADIRLIAQEPPPNPGPTAVLEHHQDTTPTDFTLAQNYPNPFNSRTVIRFNLPQRETVELAVFNLAGQQVVKLVGGRRPAGAYTVRWDGRDDQERDLASGLYVYRLQAGAQVETRKLLLVR